MSKIIEVIDIAKGFVQGDDKLDILTKASLSLDSKEFLALVGPSGCGKSTLLHIIGLLDYFDNGDIKFLGQSYKKLSDKHKTSIRRSEIGFIFQFHHLLAEFTALENVMLPLLINKYSRKDAISRASEILDDLKILDRADHKPGSLSGGEQQRVAIARAIVHKPKLLLADEPTGNLDPANADNIFKIFKAAIAKHDITTIFVTHNYELAKKSDRVLTIENGVICKI
ncbi:MAG: ABC transporter ATP-binding protein [Rickettsiales bacterium]|jgi:lipoprotein-releasing system ATP-binding protein|nr:ABC transporter ATP-binding protein [Rickettsiales bacterium]